MIKSDMDINKYSKDYWINKTRKNTLTSNRLLQKQLSLKESYKDVAESIK